MTDHLDISIVIPSYNRGHMVAENIAKCLALQPKAKEVILVDDHSGAESEAILRKLSEDYECVHYIRLPENGGQSVSRSVGLATASGKYIVSLDDDSWFLDPNSLQRVWDRMEKFPNCGILAFATSSPGFPAMPTENRLTLVADHITCGAAYRAAVLHKTGYHLSFLRFEGEESDISLKVLDQGCDILLDENVRVYHDYDLSKRSKESLGRVRKFGVRNDMLRSIIYFPAPLNILMAIAKAASHFVFGIKHGCFWSTLRGYWGFMKLLPTALRKRQPVSKSAARRYLDLRRNPESYQS